MNDDIKDILLESAIRDLQKPEISKHDRAMIIDIYLKNKKISMSQMARGLEIPKTTLHGWLQYKDSDIDKYHPPIIKDQRYYFASIKRNLRQILKLEPEDSPNMDIVEINALLQKIEHKHKEAL